MGIIINHYKDPYQTTIIRESKSFFFRGSSGKMGKTTALMQGFCINQQTSNNNIKTESRVHLKNCGVLKLRGGCSFGEGVAGTLGVSLKIPNREQEMGITFSPLRSAR